MLKNGLLRPFGLCHLLLTENMRVNMKKTFFIIILLVLIMTNCCDAYCGPEKDIIFTYGDYLYSVLKDDTAAIVGTSAHDESFCEEKYIFPVNECMVIPDEIEGHTITSISEYAFANSYLQSSLVVVPRTVALIGENAFETVNDLCDVILEEGVLEIGDNAFMGCWSMQSITIPSSIKKIGINPFYDCCNIHIHMSENKTYKLINGCLVDVINNELISGNSSNSQKNVFIPDDVTTIANYAFGGCDKIETVVISNDITKIGEAAFIRCVALQEFDIPDSVVSVGENAFRGCYKLSNVSIGKNVIYIGDNAFPHNQELTLHVYFGSYAEDYAKENSYNYEYISDTQVRGATDIWLCKADGSVVASVPVGTEMVISTYDDALDMFSVTYGDYPGYIKGTGLQLQQNGQWKNVTKAELIEMMD